MDYPFSSPTGTTDLKVAGHGYGGAKGNCIQCKIGVMKSSTKLHIGMPDLDANFRRIICNNCGHVELQSLDD